MTRSPEEIAHEFIEANKALDSKKISSLFAEDYESVHPTNPERNFKGRDQVKKNQDLVYENIKKDSLKVTVLKITPSKDSVVIEACFSAERQNDGTLINEVMIWSFDVSNGMIKRGRVYMLSLDKQKTDEQGGIEQYLKNIVHP